MSENESKTVRVDPKDVADILDVPSWAAAIYDGKIRIPFQYASLNIEKLEATI